MRSGVYVVNEPGSRRNRPNAYSAECGDVLLTKMAGESIALALAVDPTEKKKNFYRSSITKLLCCLYALVIVVLGVVFSTATALTAKEREHKYYLEVFLMYIYLMSLVILIYFQLGLLRGITKDDYYRRNVTMSLRRSTENLPKSSSPDIDRRSNGGGDHPSLEPNNRAIPERTSLGSNDSCRSLMEPHRGGVAHSGEGVNFYLRLGALGFSLGSVTLDGFNIASYFETPNTDTCRSLIFIPVYGLHLLFTFVQTFFLFKNHKLMINKSKAVVRFGLMHLMATNICAWIVTAVTETADDYRQLDYIKTVQIQGIQNNTIKSCYADVTLARTASPYLFPCVIMYSLIATGIVFKMYQYIGVRVKHHWPSHTSLTSSQPQGAYDMDCEKANKGLFLGLLVAVLTLIAIATFFVFENRLLDPITAIKVFYITEISLLVITFIGVIVGFASMSRLKFRQGHVLTLNSVLLITTVFGTFVSSCFMLISAVFDLTTYGLISILSLGSVGMVILQIILQTVFILDGLSRCVAYEEQMSTKPGRSVVTFLLVCNLALWVISMFEVKKTKVIPLHEDFYGILPWNIITHLCLPLIIFFRFHSAICLSEIWYEAYQKEKRF